MSRDFVKKLVVLFGALFVSSLVFAQPYASKTQTKKPLLKPESSSKKKIIYTKPKSELSTKMSSTKLSDAEDEDDEDRVDSEKTKKEIVVEKKEVKEEVKVEEPSKPVEEKAQVVVEEAKPIVTPKKKPQGDWDLPLQLDEDVRIAKVYEFLNDPEKTKTGHDAAYNYEFKYFNHGAVTEEQKMAKQGHYFVVSWENEGAPADVILRFDYRQAATQDAVHTLEIPFKQADGFYKATFSIIGDAYKARGNIKSWRVSVVRNGAIVAKEQSYIW